MVDTIIVHLQDPKIIIHQAALRAVSRHASWFDERQSIEVLRCLASLLHAYRDDEYQLDDICEGILSVSRRYEHLKPFALRLVESIFPTDEYYVDAENSQGTDQDFANQMKKIAALIVKDIGASFNEAMI